MKVSDLLRVFKDKQPSAATKELIELLTQAAGALEIDPSKVEINAMKKQHKDAKQVVLTHFITSGQDEDEIELGKKVLQRIVQKAKHFTNQVVTFRSITTPKAITTNKDIALYMSLIDGSLDGLKQAAEAAGFKLQ